MRFSLLVGLCICTAVIGCGPAVSDEDLGTIRFEMPTFDRDTQAFPLPELGTEEEAAADAADPHAGHDHP